ncbi:uncharacterized protein LOC136084629 isoform X1 [Hydra vulgaris]|uniref:Uncharacterized protein LOC136084629 isoform X1 n=2 Tax=Hydra vulgaris TaxID=6087 RepID=A0ABM4CH65_HYDVU
MLIAMHRLQTFYLTEIKRSFSGFGPYTLNENTHLSINIDEVPKLEDPELVIAELQAAANVSLKQLVPPSISVFSNMLTVVHNPSIKVFTVSGPDGNAHVVKLFPKESCTCPSSTMCCHVLAVKRSIGVECSERRVLNLTKLRGNSRKKGDKKSGRKKPRPGDINFIPAPDAIGAINNLDLSSFDDFSLIQNNDAKVSPTLVGIDYLHADNIATAIPLAKSKMKQKQLKLVDAYVPKKRQPSASLVSSDFQSLLYSDVIPIVNVELECIVPVDVDDWLQFNTTSVSIADRNLITSPDGLLNDKVIYAAMILCKQQFLDVDGLEDPILCFAGQCNSVPLSKRGYVQIFNDETKGHWITVANQHCKDGKINIYCSLQLIPSKECTHSISKFARIQCAVMELHINNVSRQREMLCGFYAIANCVSLCLGKDPCNFTYRESVMRQHLLACLENKCITQFPVESFRTVRKSVIRISRNTLYCVCRTIFMSSGSMVPCKLCNEWFHSSCIGLSEELFIEYKRDIQKIYKCAKCI